jgi:hypothetical protein
MDRAPFPWANRKLFRARSLVGGDGVDACYSRCSPRTPLVASDYDLIARFLLTLYMWIGTIPIDRR